MRYVYPKKGQSSFQSYFSQPPMQYPRFTQHHPYMQLRGYQGLSMSSVNVTYDGRNRTIPTGIEKVDKTTQTHWGQTLVGFWSPNVYGTGRGYWTWYLRSDALDALIAAQNELLSRGATILLTDAYRTYQQQADAYRKKPNLAVSPEQSKHTKGLAVDVKIKGGDQALLEQVMAKHGWYRTVPNEPWHFDFKGASGTPASTPAASTPASYDDSSSSYDGSYDDSSSSYDGGYSSNQSQAPAQAEDGGSVIPEVVPVDTTAQAQGSGGYGGLVLVAGLLGLGYILLRKKK